MSGIGPRDPARDARRTRRGFLVLGALAVAALVVAAAVLLAARTPDLTYSFTLKFTEDAGHPYTLLLPLPADARLDDECRYLGNGTAMGEVSDYGAVLQVKGSRDAVVTCTLATFEPEALRFSTEGYAASGQPAVRIFLNSSGTAHHPVINLAFRETGKDWITTRYVQGDLTDGWTTINVREVVEPTPDYTVPPTT